LSWSASIVQGRYDEEMTLLRCASMDQMATFILVVAYCRQKEEFAIR
jgi:hypothetical protein